MLRRLDLRDGKESTIVRFEVADERTLGSVRDGRGAHRLRITALFGPILRPSVRANRRRHAV